MLRLRPSEITLTPADVEETRRRMARKQAAVPVATRSTRAARPQVRQPPPPRLRRGPEHSRDDAITSLGHIPDLRPHQAVHSSADDDLEEGFATTSSHAGETNTNDIPTTSSPAEQTTSIPSQNAPDTSTFRAMQLPFRPAHARLGSIENTEDNASPSPPKHSYGYSAFGRARTNTSEETNEGPAQSRPGSTDGLTEAPSASAMPGRGRVRSVRQHSSHTPSPLHQAHAVSSPRQQETDHTSTAQYDTPMEVSPTVYLQGYFASPEQYTFREYPLVPRTEPRRRTQRPAQMVRTMSSSSDPSYPALTRPPDSSQPLSTTEDIFWTPPSANRANRDASDSVEGSERHRRRPSLEVRIRSGSHSINEFVHDRYRGLFSRARAVQAGHDHASSSLDANRHTSAQQISEASSTSSLPFSYYELPVSRHSSSNHSQVDHLVQAQYDGAASSREFSRGAYFSIRPSQVHVRPPLVRVPSYSSPNLQSALGQHRVSPGPSRPYSNGPRGSTRQHQREAHDNEVGPSTGLIRYQDLLGDDQDAANAAQRDLSSPLELLELRASSYLSRVSAALHASSGSSQRSSENHAIFQYQVADFDEQQLQERRRTSSADPRQSSGNSVRIRPTTSWRYPAGTRSGQRSSENVPVGAQAQATMGRIQNGPAAHGGNMRGGETLSSPIPIRFSMPHASSPRDMSNRPQLQSPYLRSSAVRSPRDLDRDNNPYSSSPTSPFRGRRRGSQNREYVPLRQHRSIAHEDEPSRRTPARTLLDGPPYPIPPRNPERSSFTPTLNQGPRTRRPVITRAPTSRRRITPEQQNQENSGEVEEQLMGEERAAAGMRYGNEVGQLDIMDETPPRVGRFERHAMG